MKSTDPLYLGVDVGGTKVAAGLRNVARRNSLEGPRYRCRAAKTQQPDCAPSKGPSMLHSLSNLLGGPLLPGSESSVRGPSIHGLV